MAAVFTTAAVLAANQAVAGWLGLAFIPYALSLRKVPTWQRLGVLRGGDAPTVLRRWDLDRIWVDSRGRDGIGVQVEVGAHKVTLRASKAVSFLAEILPRVNWDGGTHDEIVAATSDVDAAEAAAASAATPHHLDVWELIAKGPLKRPGILSRFGVVKRLALEMAVTEEMERRSFIRMARATAPVAENESEIAQIADNMFLPASINEQLARLKQKRPAS